MPKNLESSTLESRTQASIAFLQKLITYPTITPKECGIFQAIEEKLLGFSFLRIQENGTSNLFAYKKGGLDFHFCFMGHIDVVPPGEGWSEEAFGGEIKDGFIYGRGAQDMKAGVSAFVCALSDFIADKNMSTLPTLSILLTSDEEGEGTYGTRFVLEKLQAQNLLPNFAIVAEPTCVERFGDMIKIGRRGSINGVLEILGKQGHVAYPQKCNNPIEALGENLGKIAGVNLDNGDECFAPSKLVVTDIRGGMQATNVTPDSVKIMFNVRNSSHTTLKSLESYLQTILQRITQTQGISCKLTLTQSSKPFLTNKDSTLVSLLSQSVYAIAKTKPTLSTSGGTSDARFCGEYGIDVVEFGVCNDRIHSVDERVCIDEVKNLYRVFSDFLEHIERLYK